MTKEEIIEKLRSLAPPTPSGWRERAEARQANPAVILHARKEALRILDAMHQKGISKSRLSRLAGVSVAAINKVVQGKTAPDGEVIRKIDLALDNAYSPVDKPVAVSKNLSLVDIGRVASPLLEEPKGSYGRRTRRGVEGE